MNINTEDRLDRLRLVAELRFNAEFLMNDGYSGSDVWMIPEGKQLIAACKALRTAATKFIDADKRRSHHENRDRDPRDGDNV